jgi:hypothetical protein
MHETGSTKSALEKGNNQPSGEQHSGPEEAGVTSYPIDDRTANCMLSGIDEKVGAIGAYLRQLHPGLKLDEGPSSTWCSV